MEFVIRPEIMKSVKNNRLAMLEQQIADTTLNVIILEAATTRTPQDDQQLTNELARREKLIATYRIVEGVSENG